MKSWQFLALGSAFFAALTAILSKAGVKGAASFWWEREPGY